jgi:pimeloyl-ACP methyl ester carboxylesterase
LSIQGKTSMAEPLVLIPGLLNDERLFEAQVAALSADRTVVVADHRSDPSMKEIAARILRTSPDRFALAGLSMGGYAALEIMRQAPERVTRLALIDTSARPDTEEARADRLRMIGIVEAGGFPCVPDMMWPKLLSPRSQDNADLKARLRAMMLEVGPVSYVMQQKAIMSRGDSRELLATLEIPVLIMVGEDDVLTPPDLAREMANLVEWSSLAIIAEAGHLSPMENPEAVTEALRAWLDAG